MNEIVKDSANVLADVIIKGDLKSLKPEDKVLYYKKVCESLGLNPLTRPFEYIVLNGKETLYIRKDATEQLRSIKNISITGLESKIVDDIYIVTAYAEMNNKKDVATGAVSIKGQSGDNRANAIMKAETKAKRRVTLSISGLGFLDESELDTISDKVCLVKDAANHKDEGVYHYEVYLKKIEDCLSLPVLKSIVEEVNKNKSKLNPSDLKSISSKIASKKLELEKPVMLDIAGSDHE